jgi:hypothetical protein
MSFSPAAYYAAIARKEHHGIEGFVVTTRAVGRDYSIEVLNEFGGGIVKQPATARKSHVLWQSSETRQTCLTRCLERARYTDPTRA